MHYRTLTMHYRTHVCPMCKSVGFSAPHFVRFLWWHWLRSTCNICDYVYRWTPIKDLGTA